MNYKLQEDFAYETMVQLDFDLIARNKLLQDVRDFHDKFNLREGWKPNKHNLTQRYEMMLEEVNEFKDAIERHDHIDAIDALADLMYFALGTADLMDIDFDAHWNAVQDANMEKIRGTKSTRPNTNGFDCIKPEGWVAPEGRHKKILETTPGNQEELFK